MARLSKRQKQMNELVGDQAQFSPSEAVELVKKTSLAKFDETVEVAFCLGINPKHADQQVRSTVSLPEGTGQTDRVVVAAKGPAHVKSEYSSPLPVRYTEKPTGVVPTSCTPILVDIMPFAGPFAATNAPS